MTPSPVVALPIRLLEAVVLDRLLLEVGPPELEVVVDGCVAAEVFVQC